MDDQSSQLGILVSDIVGSPHGNFQVAPSLSAEGLRASVGASLKLELASFELLFGTTKLQGGSTLASYGLSEGAQLTLVRLTAAETLVMWVDDPDDAGLEGTLWPHTLSPKLKVSQMVVGPYSAFILLEDGTCRRVGPHSPDDLRPFSEPKPVAALSAPVRRLGIDYMTLVAMTGDEVWLHDTSGCGGAIRDVLAGEGVREAPRLGGDCVRADRICGWDVRQVCGDQCVGFVRTAAGSLHMYASRSVCFSLDAFGYLEGLEALIEEHGGSLLLEVHVEGKAVDKVGMTQLSVAAGLLLNDGTVAVVPCANMTLKDGALHVPTLRGLEGMVDITVDGQVALDKAGCLWRLETGARIAVSQGDKVEALRGDVAVAARPSGLLAACGIGRRLAVPWAWGLQTCEHAQQGRWFGMACLSGEIPKETLTIATESAETCGEGGANLMAYQCGRYDELLPEDGCDVARLKSLLAAGCSVSTNSPDGEPLLLTFALKATAGETGMTEAVQLLIQSGGDDDLKSSAVAGAVAAGDRAALEVLRAAGCAVSDADYKRCVDEEEEAEEDA